VSQRSAAGRSLTTHCASARFPAVLPRFEGIETVENRFFFTTLSDALALERP
jgi:hypothetical protein